MDGWYFRPNPGEIVMHGTWPYGDVTADVCVRNPDSDLAAYEVLFGRPGQAGEYAYPSNDGSFRTLDAARLYAERKVALTWDLDPLTPPAAVAAMTTPFGDATDDRPRDHEEKRSKVG